MREQESAAEATPPKRQGRRLTARGSLWLGPFTTVEQANRAVNAAGGVLVAFAAFPLISLLTGVHDTFMVVSVVITAALFGLPGAFLLLGRNVLAANIAVGVCGVLLALMAVGLFALLSSQSISAGAPMALSGSLLFGAVAFLCCRARQATRFLKPLKDPSLFD